MREVRRRQGSAVARLCPGWVPDWRERAACRPGSAVDPEVFFPVSESPGEVIAASTALCRRCPVRAQCLAEAVGRGEADGTWGGVPEWARDRLRTGSSVSRRPGAANVADRGHADRVSAAEYRRAAASAVVSDGPAPGGYVDEVAVEVAVAGSRPVRLTEAERLAATARLVARGWTPNAISKRLRCGIATARALVDRVQTQARGADGRPVPNGAASGADPVAVA